MTQPGGLSRSGAIIRTCRQVPGRSSDGAKGRGSDRYGGQRRSWPAHLSRLRGGGEQRRRRIRPEPRCRRIGGPATAGAQREGGGVPVRRDGPADGRVSGGPGPRRLRQSRRARERRCLQQVDTLHRHGRPDLRRVEQDPQRQPHRADAVHEGGGPRHEAAGGGAHRQHIVHRGAGPNRLVHPLRGLQGGAEPPDALHGRWTGPPKSWSTASPPGSSRVRGRPPTWTNRTRSRPGWTPFSRGRRTRTISQRR